MNISDHLQSEPLAKEVDDEEPIVLDENDIVYFNESEIVNVKDDGFVDTYVFEEIDDIRLDDAIPTHSQSNLNDNYKKVDNELGSSGVESFQEDVVRPLADKLSQSMIQGLELAQSQDNEPVNELATSADDKLSQRTVLERIFGKSERHAEVQTHELRDFELQTEVTQSVDKYAQHPHFATGSNLYISDPFELCSFLQRAEKIVDLIADKIDASAERNSAKCSRRVLKIPQGTEQFCGQFYKLVCSPLAKHAAIKFIASDNQYLFSVQNVLKSDGEKCLIAMWPLVEAVRPEHLLIARSAVNCCASDKRGRMFGGMVDGTVAVWDICEPAHLHRNILIDSVPFTLRAPSFSSACVSKNEGHQHPIINVHVLGSEVANFDSALIASVDSSGTVIIWELKKVYHSEVSYSQEGEGMLPGSNVKLVKKSQFSCKAEVKQTITCSAVSLELADQVYLGCDRGHVIRASRFTDDTMLPTNYIYSFAETISSVTAIAFSSSNYTNFLVGYVDGSLALFCVEFEEPEQIWEPGDTQMSSIVNVEWDTKRSTIFYVLDANSSIYLWDLASSTNSPLYTFSSSK